MTTLDLRPDAVALTLQAQELVRLLNVGDEHQAVELADTIAERAAAIAGDLHESAPVGYDSP
jgi:hypothetical protein